MIPEPTSVTGTSSIKREGLISAPGTGCTETHIFNTRLVLNELEHAGIYLLNAVFIFQTQQRDADVLQFSSVQA